MSHQYFMLIHKDALVQVETYLRHAQALLEGVIKHIEKLPVSNLEIASADIRKARVLLGKGESSA